MSVSKHSPTVVPLLLEFRSSGSESGRCQLQQMVILSLEQGNLSLDFMMSDRQMNLMEVHFHRKSGNKFDLRLTANDLIFMGGAGMAISESEYYVTSAL